MKTAHKILLLTTMSLALSACEMMGSGQGFDPAELESVDVTNVESVNLAIKKTWTVDTLELVPAPQAFSALSTTYQGLQVDNLRAVFGQDLTQTSETVDTVELDSENIRATVEPTRGQFDIRYKRSFSDAKPVQVDRNALKAESIEIVRGLGVAPEQMGSVLQKSIMRSDMETDGTRRTTLDAHVTIVTRAINGVPVLGSRIVVFHDRAGQVIKTMGSWPEIQMEGSRLSTPLNRQAVQQRFDADLAQRKVSLRPRSARNGEAKRRVLPDYVLVPQETENGQVTLDFQLRYTVYPEGRNESEGAPRNDLFKPVEFFVTL